MVMRAVDREEVANEVGMIELVDVAAEGAVVDEVAKAPGGAEHEISGGGAEGFAREDAGEERGAGGIAGIASGADVERRKGHELSVEGGERARLALINRTFMRVK